MQPDDGLASYAVVAHASSARGDVTLARRGSDRYELRVNGVYVMDTTSTATEEALAELALAAVDSPRRVLLGGLGLGFTARALLRHRGVERLVIAELEPALVGWLRDGLIPCSDIAADPRARPVVGDVRDVVRAEAPGTVDAIVLDVDNGPGNLVHAANAGLYEAEFLRLCADRLRPGGVVAVWASTPSPELDPMLTETVGGCVAHRLPVRLGARADEYLVYVATRRHGQR
jgi:spermidine synthase